MRRGFRQFAAAREGLATVDFVVIFFGLIAMVFFVVELTLYMFFMSSLEKAAEAGARAAVVSPPVVVGGIPSTITRSASGVFGYKCSHASAPCVPFATQTCTGTACEPVPFDRIFAHIRGFNGRIEKQHVTITYADVGIGFAGGPTVPMVTVTISDVPFQTGILGLLLTNTGNLAELPPRSANMTGEDLAL
jgi:hypothetical protein